MYYLKYIWQWLKNIRSRTLAFFGFKVSTKNNINESNSSDVRKQGNEIALGKDKNINVGKSDSSTICKQKNSTALSEVKEGVQHIIDGIDPENIKEFKDFFTSPQNPGWYTSEGILISLFDLLLDCNKEKPVILVQGANFNPKPLPLSEEFEEISKLYNDRNILYIRLHPTETPGKDRRHWVIFYFFRENKQNKLLFVDPFGQEKDSKDIQKRENLEDIQKALEYFLRPFSRKKEWNFCVSTTKIQQDCYSCGLITSEVARMIYLNHVNIGTINDDFVDLGNFLPSCELNQLIASCGKEGEVNYGGEKCNFNASNFRTAHYSVALKLGLAGNIIASNSPRQISLHKILNGEKIDYSETEKLEKEHGLTEESIAVVEKIRAIRASFIGCQTNVEEFSQSIKALDQASKENIDINQTHTDNQAKNAMQLISKPEKLDQSYVEGIESNETIKEFECNSRSC